MLVDHVAPFTRRRRCSPARSVHPNLNRNPKKQTDQFRCGDSAASSCAPSHAIIGWLIERWSPIQGLEQCPDVAAGGHAMAAAERTRPRAGPLPGNCRGDRNRPAPASRAFPLARGDGAHKRIEVQLFNANDALEREAPWCQNSRRGHEIRTEGPADSSTVSVACPSVSPWRGRARSLPEHACSAHDSIPLRARLFGPPPQTPGSGPATVWTTCSVSQIGSPWLSKEHDHG